MRLTRALMESDKSQGQIVLAGGQVVMTDGSDEPIASSYLMNAATYEWSPIDIPHNPPFTDDSGHVFFNAATSTMVLFYTSLSDQGAVWFLDLTTLSYGCESLPATVPDGSVSCTNRNSPGSVCTTTCATHFRVNGTAARTCSASGQGGQLWSGTPATCVCTYSVCRRGFAEPLTALFVPACLCTSNPLSCSECFSRNVHMRCRPNSWFSLHGGLRSGLCVGRQCDPHLRRSSAVGWQGAVPSRMPRVNPASRGSRVSFLLAWSRPGVDMLLVVQAGLPCEWVDRADL